MKRIGLIIFSMFISMNVPVCGQTSVDADIIKGWVDKTQELFYKGDGQGAYEWYLRAAEQVNPFAEFALDVLYLNVLHVKQNFDKAFYWRLKAAKQGFKLTQLSVAEMYEKRIITSENFEEATYWQQ